MALLTTTPAREMTPSPVMLTPKRRTCGDQSPQDSDQGHQYGNENNQGDVEAVKLAHQHDQNQEHRNRKGLAEEIFGFLLFVIGTAEPHIELWRNCGFGNPLNDPLLNLIGIGAFDYIAADRDNSVFGQCA